MATDEGAGPNVCSFLESLEVDDENDSCSFKGQLLVNASLSERIAWDSHRHVIVDALLKILAARFGTRCPPSKSESVSCVCVWFAPRVLTVLSLCCSSGEVGSEAAAENAAGAAGDDDPNRTVLSRGAFLLDTVLVCQHEVVLA